MGLRDRLAADAARLAKGAASAAEQRIVDSDKAGARLVAMIRMDDDRPITVEAWLVLLIDAVHSDEARDLTDRDVKKAAKRRQRRAGAAGALGGPIGMHIASLYCEAEILCDLVERHRLELSEPQIAAHLLVLWNAMPDVASAQAAIDGTGPSVLSRLHGQLRDTVGPGDDRAMTKKDVVRSLWKLRGALDDVDLPGSSSGFDVLLPGRRVKALTLAAERQLGVHD
jgi:hypothetical protein